MTNAADPNQAEKSLCQSSSQGPRKGKALTVVHSLGGLYKFLVVCHFFLSYLMSGAWSAGIILGSALVFIEQAEVQKRASNFAWSCRMLVLG